jgi:PAS domain S-box-containing protein
VDFFRRLFQSDFMPQRDCFRWQPEILWLNAGSDAVIALACCSIPIVLITVARRRSDLELGRALYLFSAFILLCGAAHGLGIWTVWSGAYRLEGVIKLAAAGASLATALLLWPLLPKVMRAPGPKQLALENEELRREVAERNAALKHSLSVGGRERDLVRQREEQFRRAVEASPAAFVLIDARGRIQLVNSQAERSFGYDRSELVGQPVEKLVPDPVREKHPQRVADFLANPRAMALNTARELHGRHKGGWLFPVEIGLSPIETPSGLQVLASVQDITERKRAEKRIDRKTRELERSNRELEQFAYVVSHDLKSPLRGIATLAEWIATDHAAVLDDEARGQLELLRERAGRMHRMIEGILEYSRAGRGSERRGPVDAGLVVRAVIEMLAPPLNIEIRVAEPLPPCVCDETQLAQVFQNLIANAIQHLGKPHGVITVSGRADGEAVEYSVSDDGVGIAPEHHERIFRIFQTLRDDGKGHTTGIGLSIVQKIVRSNGGELALESSPGGGSTFRFMIPGSHE